MAIWIDSLGGLKGYQSISPTLGLPQLRNVIITRCLRGNKSLLLNINRFFGKLLLILQLK